MKIFSKVLLATALTTVASSCSSFLDINTNPNAATSVTPDQLLANALVTTGAVYTNYNTYTSFAAGFWGKANGVSGYNVEHQYGDIPYFNALKGADNTTPAFDKADVIYKDLIVQLKGAIADINASTSATKPGTEDASTDGYITTDVVVQPGYAASSGQQNPFYNTYGFAVGSAATTSTYRFILPTNYLVNLFRNNSDTRLVQEFRPISGTTTTYQGTNLGEPLPPDYLTGSTFQAALSGSPAGTFAGTFLRSPSQPVVLMLLAEHLFSKSEAEFRALFTNTADAKADYLN
nr:hypothetical protein [Tanacetum cinerariifolium]